VAILSPVAPICLRSWVNTAFAERELRARLPGLIYWDQGSIDGTVIDQRGSAVAGAAVIFGFTGPSQGVAPRCETDANGYFKKPLRWGSYAVYAGKEEDGYPELWLNFFGGNPPVQTVTLKSGHADVTVTVHLGQKAGRVQGNVTDARTATPLDANLELRWASDPGNWFPGSSSGHFSELIPGNTGVLWKVWLDGYKPWYYPGTTDERKATAIQLESGEVRTTDIQLQRDSRAGKRKRRD
jgi:hypothetical protein